MKMTKVQQIEFLKRAFAAQGMDVHVIDMAVKTNDPDEGLYYDGCVVTYSGTYMLDKVLEILRSTPVEVCEWEHYT